ALAAMGTTTAALLVSAWSQLSALDPSISLVAVVLLPTLILYPASETVYAKLQIEADYTGLSLRQLLPNLVRLGVASLALALGLQLLEVATLLSASLTVLALLFMRSVAKAGSGG